MFTKILIRMETNIDFLINFLKKYTPGGGKTSEIDEQAGAAPAPSTGGGEKSAGRAVKKWESGRKFGPTYQNDPKHQWTSGRAMGKTYMGDPKYKWESGRTMGKTGGSDFA